jgi:Fe-Mn family superoxide dismutase
MGTERAATSGEARTARPGVALPIQERSRTVTRYILPNLEYDYGALEPHISAEIMQLHHDKHHRAYVDGANRAIDDLQEARKKRDFGRIALLERALAFNVSGHVLHSMFWQNLSANGGGKPTGEFERTLTRDFGSFDLFQQQLIQVAMTIMGSGWAALVWDPVMNRLGTTQIHDHQSEITQAGIPLLVLDAWEHAYYLQYRTDKAKFFRAVWELWNWDDVAERHAAAQLLDLKLRQTADGGTRPSAPSIQ